MIWIFKAFLYFHTHKQSSYYENPINKESSCVKVLTYIWQWYIESNASYHCSTFKVCFECLSWRNPGLPLDFSAPTLTVYVCLILPDDHYDISLSGTSHELTSPVTTATEITPCHLSVSPSFHSHISQLTHTPVVPLHWPVTVLLSVNKVLRHCPPPNYNTAFLFYMDCLNGATYNISIQYPCWCVCPCVNRCVLFFFTMY